VLFFCFRMKTVPPHITFIVCNVKGSQAIWNWMHDWVICESAATFFKLKCSNGSNKLSEGWEKCLETRKRVQARRRCYRSPRYRRSSLRWRYRSRPSTDAESLSSSETELWLAAMPLRSRAQILRPKKVSDFLPDRLPSFSVFCRIGDIPIPTFRSNVTDANTKCVGFFIQSIRIRQIRGIAL
jgi:hypothetical protein